MKIIIVLVKLEVNFVSLTVEFPAVLMNTRNGIIQDEFHRYIFPQENPTLSNFCKELTGITQVK